MGLGELLALLQALPVEFPLEWGGEGKVCLFMERLLYAVSRPGAITKKPQNLSHSYEAGVMKPIFQLRKLSSMDISPDSTTRKWQNRHSNSGRLTPGAALLLHSPRLWADGGGGCACPLVWAQKTVLLPPPGSCWLFLL